MGNYRFRLSDMIPNAWFYKLKDMSSKARNKNISNPTRKNLQPNSSSTSSSSSSSAAQQRKSYYFTRELSPQPSHIRFYNNSAASPKFTTQPHLPEPPRKSSKKRRSTSTKRQRASNRLPPPRLTTSVSSGGCSCRPTIESVWTKPDSTPEEYPTSPLDSSSSENESLLPEPGSGPALTSPETLDGRVSWSAPCHCTVDNFIVIDMDNNKNKFDAEFDKLDDGVDSVTEIELPPIITKPTKFTHMVAAEVKEKERNEPTKYRRGSAKLQDKNTHGTLSVKLIKEDISTISSKEHRNSPVRRSSASPQGMKLRTNSPRIASRRIQGRKSISSSSSSRRSLSESVAVVKSSQDPQRDFKESMVEMILENNLRASKDLEDLLACYLSLNSNEYHDLIIKVFKQIWFDVTDIKL